jgi:hypothetical protein
MSKKNKNDAKEQPKPSSVPPKGQNNDKKKK